MKHINFFTKGYCEADSAEDFINGEVGRLLQEIHGELKFTFNNRPNFINVYHDGNKMFIGEALFYDFLPDMFLLGSIVPEYLDFETKERNRGGDNSFGYALSRFGYIVKHTPLPSETIQGVKSMDFFEHTCGSKSTLEAPKEDGVVRVDHHHSYEMTYEYFNADENKIKNYCTKEVKPFIFRSRTEFTEMFKGNYLLSTAFNPKTWIQRTTKGHSLSPHFDGNFNKGLSPYVNATTWICDGDFEGREFIAGKRTEQDLINWISKALSSTDLADSSVHELSPEDYIETLSLKPETGKTALINSFNPLFYHGVNTHLGGAPVYSIINDFQLR